jgi:hypothetical protein
MKKRILLGVRIRQLEEVFLKNMNKKYGKHTLWPDSGMWYARLGSSVNLEHHLYPRAGWMLEVMERQIQRLKNMTESFDDLFPCRNDGVRCRLKHVKNLINVFFLHRLPDYVTFSEDVQKNLELGQGNGAQFRFAI